MGHGALRGLMGHMFAHRRETVDGVLVGSSEPLLLDVPAGAEVIDVDLSGGGAAVQIGDESLSFDADKAKRHETADVRIGIPEAAYGGKIALQALSSSETRVKLRAVASSSWTGYGGTRKMLRFTSRLTNGAHAIEVGKAYPAVTSSISMICRLRVSANMAGQTGAICGLFPAASTDQVPSLRLSHFPNNRLTVIATENNGSTVSTAQDNVNVIPGAEYFVVATYDASTKKVGIIRYTESLGVYAITATGALTNGLNVQALTYFFTGSHNADGHFFEGDIAELGLYFGVLPVYQALAAVGPNAFPWPEYVSDPKLVRAYIPLLSTDPLRDWQTNRRLAPINGGSSSNVQIVDSDFHPQLQANCLLPMDDTNVINQEGNETASAAFAGSANCKTGMHLARIDHDWSYDVAASSPNPALARATEILGGATQLVGLGADLVASIKNQSGNPADTSTLNLVGLGCKKLEGVPQFHVRSVLLGDVAGAIIDGEWCQYGDIETIDGWRDPFTGKCWFIFLSGNTAWIGYVDPLTGLWTDPVAGGFQVNAGQWADITRAIKATMCGSANNEIFIGGILEGEKNQCGFSTILRDEDGEIIGFDQQQCGDVGTYVIPETLGMFNPLVIQNPAATARVMVGSMQGGAIAYIRDDEEVFHNIPNTPSNHPDVCFRWCRNTNKISTMSCQGVTEGRPQWTDVFTNQTQIVVTDVTGYRGQGGQEADFDVTGYHSPAFGMQLCFISQVLNRTGVRKYVPATPTTAFGETLCPDGYVTLRTVTIADMIAQGALPVPPSGQAWFVQSIEPGPADWHWFTVKRVDDDDNTIPVMQAYESCILIVNFETGVVRRVDRGILDGNTMIRHEAEPVLMGPYPGNRARICGFINEKTVDLNPATITRTDVFVDTGIVVQLPEAG